MAGANRFLASLEDARTSNPHPSRYFQGNIYPGEDEGFSTFAERSKAPQFDAIPDDELPLDDFGESITDAPITDSDPWADRELLAERQDDPHQKPTQDHASLSWPSQTASNGSNAFGRRPTQDYYDSNYACGSSLPPAGQKSCVDPLYVRQSSSPMKDPFSSPTDHLLALRNNRSREHLTLPQNEQRLKAFNKACPSIAYKPPHKANTNRGTPRHLELGHAPPIVQGIQLVPTTDLPDRFRGLFKFPVFNAIQSKLFRTAFTSNGNLVLSAPTGSGKTVIMELAICRLVSLHRTGDFKIVYQAPTKSLCSERYQDWNQKFGSLGLKCAELTGDTPSAQLRDVQSASIIVTTPEKWDSVTRKWKDHARLMQMIKLFLIDEVHILRDIRGATLEAVVSRMKSVGGDARFVALSATVPNSEDIATWIGKDTHNAQQPAHREVFGEEFRPVKLEKLVYGFPSRNNDFIFDKILSPRYVLPLFYDPSLT